MIDITKQYKTRSGLPVRIYCNDGAANEELHGAYTADNGQSWSVLTWRADGCFYGDGREHELNLVEVRAQHIQTYWLIHSRSRDAYTSCEVRFLDPLKTDAGFHSSVVAITGPHEVTFADGEGLPKQLLDEPAPAIEDDGVPF